jgi:hypothetical protein
MINIEDRKLKTAFFENAAIEKYYGKTMKWSQGGFCN